MKYTSGIVASGTVITFRVGNFINAPSTEETATFTSIRTFDSDGDILEIYNEVVTPVTVTNDDPAAVTTKALSQSITSFSTAATYTITYTNINVMPSGSAFEITYPSTVTVPVTLTTCNIR